MYADLADRHFIGLLPVLQPHFRYNSLCWALHGRGSFIMSAHLTWMIVRNNNAYLLKKRNVKKPFSTEPNNLTNLSSFRYSGLVHKKSVGVVAAPDNKGFTVVYKKSRASYKPAKSVVKRTMKAGPRRSLYKLKRLLKANKYRTDLTRAALRRASAVLKSQKPLPVKKARAKKSD